MDMFLLMALLIICLFTFAFFSGVEVALVSVSQIKARSLATQGKKGSKALMRLKEDPDDMLTTILIGTNIANVGASALATVMATETLGDVGLGVATGVMTFMFLVFGEITPKTYAANHNVRIALWVARPIEILKTIMAPLIWMFGIFKDFVKSISGGLSGPILTEQDLKTIVQVGYEQEVLDEKDRQIINGVIRFDDIEVRNVMTPKTRVFSMHQELTVGQAMDRFSKTKYSRAIIYGESEEDDIIGIVNIRDLVRGHTKDSSLKLSAITRKAMRTSSTTRVNELLKDMQRLHQHIAIVESDNRYVGIVTLEDLIEEILGEIWDEQDLTPDMIVRTGKKTYLVHCDTLLDTLEEFLKVFLKEEDPQMTVGEFVTDLVGEGNSARVGDVELEIVERHGLAIKSVKARIVE